ncbi:hypothetical protein SSPS47_22120 [Streptomyces sp. S4.7]|uniref:hypothetical protein n=1 Tax=Streptomyces sp. S4.7 TaxID=2705439 RepID=UPI0013987C8A|nr:hypothetical protein [Streptomyces sp. S4.7]QHY97809.1 hypothetical protein SSPS47_22120 [Streptomyces sp. S4.7]
MSKRTGFKRLSAVLGATAVLGMVSSAGAQAAPAAGDVSIQAYAEAKYPRETSSKIIAEGVHHGPNAIGTRLCVSLLIHHPVGPPIVGAKSCKTITAGSHAASINISCSVYETWVDVLAPTGSTVHSGRSGAGALGCT